MSAYYNENDAFAAGWLRELIRAGLVAPGEVDERSILDVQPSDLADFTQCHFFAGIGVWSLALRNAGWSDDSPVWTGSCPCQSFSQSGKRGGFGDPRHLWPAWFRLIRERRPHVVFGEQVASRDGLAWLDVVCADLEGEAYAVGACDLCAAGFGAPHIRQRLYFVAESRREQYRDAGDERGFDGATSQVGREARSRALQFQSLHHGEAGLVADADLSGQHQRSSGGEQSVHHEMHEGGELGYAEQPRLQEQRGVGGVPRGQARATQGQAAERTGASTGGMENPERAERRSASEGRDDESDRPDTGREEAPGGRGFRGPTGGFWRSAQWLPCRDGKLRPVEPGSPPLVAGAPNRVGRLRGYGNALCAPVAEAFVRAYMEVLDSGAA